LGSGHFCASATQSGSNACTSCGLTEITLKETHKSNDTEQLTSLRLFGFLFGATTAGAGMYYYVIDEYRVSNQLLTEDIYVRLYALRNEANDIG
jgi:hypothetical protein